MNELKPMQRIRHGLAVLAALAAALSATTSFAEDAIEQYRLEAGDRVRITVFGHADLSGEFEVSGAGAVSLPLVRDIEAQGHTTGELAAAITDKLKPDYLRNPRVSVDIINYRPFYILGEVKNPGSYPYASNMTVVNAIAVAGGYTYRASKRKINVVRASDPDKQPEPVDEDTRIYPGDVIKVPERFF